MVERMSDRQAFIVYTVIETGSVLWYSKHTWFSISSLSGAITVLYYIHQYHSASQRIDRPVLNVPTVDMGCKR